MRSTRILTAALVATSCFVAAALISPRPAKAQGKNAPDWATANANPQRDGWVRTDPQISRQNLKSMKGWGVVRKVQLGGATGVQAGLPAFDLVANARGGYGFKSIGYITDASGNVVAIDSDMPLVYWKTQVGSAPTATCPGTVAAGVAQVTPISPALAAPGRAGGGRANPPGMPADFPGRGKSGSMVGNPDEGAPSLKYFGIGAPAASGAQAGGGGGAGRGQVAMTGGTVQPFPYKIAIPFPNVTVGAPGGTGAGRGGGTPGMFALTGDGSVRSLSQHGGYDVFMGPTKFLPSGMTAYGLIALEGAADPAAAAAAGPGRGGATAPPLLYVATTKDCSATAVPGVWALNLDSPNRQAVVWKTNGGSVAGTAGPAIGNDGVVYAATADGDYSPAALSDSVVSLEPKTLKLKDFFSPGKFSFVSSPVVIDRNNHDLLAVMNEDGKMYLLDTSSLGGADHKTPLSVSAKFANIGERLPGALASWKDTDGSLWVLTSITGAPASTTGFRTNGNPTNGSIVAMKVVDQGGKAALQPGWISRDVIAPLSPIVVNGVVFAAGKDAQGNAVLYALDGSTGQEILNTPLTGGAPKGMLSSQFSTVYVQTADNTLWSLGFPQDKEDFGALTK